MFDRISLSALKVVKSRSFETVCFTAKLSFDGVLIATVENDGQGSPNFVRALPGKQEQVKAAEAWAKSLPPEQGYSMELPMDLEFAISLVVDEMQKTADLQKQFKSIVDKAGFVRNGKVYTFKGVSLKKLSEVDKTVLISRLHSANPGIKFLAEMEEKVAFEKFSATVK